MMQRPASRAVFLRTISCEAARKWPFRLRCKHCRKRSLRATRDARKDNVFLDSEIAKFSQSKADLRRLNELLFQLVLSGAIPFVASFGILRQSDIHALFPISPPRRAMLGLVLSFPDFRACRSGEAALFEPVADACLACFRACSVGRGTSDTERIGGGCSCDATEPCVRFPVFIVFENMC